MEPRPLFRRQALARLATPRKDDAVLMLPRSSAGVILWVVSILLVSGLAVIKIPVIHSVSGRWVAQEKTISFVIPLDFQPIETGASIWLTDDASHQRIRGMVKAVFIENNQRLVIVEAREPVTTAAFIVEKQTALQWLWQNVFHPDTSK